MDATHRFLGTTAARAQLGYVRRNGRREFACAEHNRRDSVSVTDFGPLPGERAFTCVWVNVNNQGVAVESDTRLDNDPTRWSPYGTERGCRNRWSVAAVATHERGHTFGIHHVGSRDRDDENTDPSGLLTMSPLIEGPCQNSEFTLGRGDVLGLRAKY